MATVLVDLGAGNLHSAAKAFARMAAEAGLPAPRVTDRPEEIARADRVVLPGDGAFPACMDALDASDLRAALREAVETRGRPFLGICVGMQMMARQGFEYRATPGLAWIDGAVVRVTPSDPALKVPHMGWNDLVLHRPHPVLDGLGTGDHAYFVHSYQMRVDAPGQCLATVDYGGPVTAVVGRDTMIGTQFHPEKSQRAGLRLIANFLRWAP